MEKAKALLDQLWLYLNPTQQQFIDQTLFIQLISIMMLEVGKLRESELCQKVAEFMHDILVSKNLLTPFDKNVSLFDESSVHNVFNAYGTLDEPDHPFSGFTNTTDHSPVHSTI